MSVAAYRWVFRHVADYGIAPDRNRDDFGPYRLTLLLADYTSPKDPHEGAWPRRDTLAAGLGVDPTTVKRWTARLREAGVIEVQEYAGPPTGKRGRKSHRYLIPGFLASLDLRGTPSVVTPLKLEEDRRDWEGTPRGETPPKTDELEGTDDELEGVEPRIGGHGHAQDAPRGRYLKEGKEGGSADAAPLPPQCKRHPDGPAHDEPCRACGRWRKHLGDNRELTREEVDNLLGPDYRQPPQPPKELLDDVQASLAWVKAWGVERRAKRQEQARARLRARQNGTTGIEPWR